MNEYPGAFDEIIDEPHQGNGKASNGEAPRFRLEAFADITIGDGPEWLVSDIVPAAGFTVVYGEAGCGKSFLASDMGLAVALGLPWAGKEVQPGTVVYITAEGASGFRKRLVAYRQHYDIAAVPVPFHVIAAAPNLGNEPGDGAELIGAIETQAEGPIRAVIIDTLARTMHGADENSAAAMGLFADHCARIGERLGCAVLALHHCGKDGGKGARGSSALRAAADCEILVEGSQERRTATVTKAKDGEDGWTLPFKLNRVEVEAPGREVSSCILEAAGEWAIDAGSTQKGERPVSRVNKIALDALRRAIEDAGERPPASNHIPGQVQCVSAELWRQYFYKMRSSDSEDARRKSFQRARDTLQERNLVGAWGEWIWTC